MNSFFYSISCIIILITQACQGVNQASSTEEFQTQSYFSLHSYFQSEANRLQNQIDSIHKTVEIDQQIEMKTVKIQNWQEELHVFMESDINKPAWSKSYQIDSSDFHVTYTALEENLRTRKVVIKKNSLQKVEAILISNVTKNNLYATIENLEYYPDSLYKIETQQAVQVLGKKTYKISGQLDR